MSRSASYVEISNRYGFNRYYLIDWEFESDQVILHFFGKEPVTLTGSEADLFRNWVKDVAKSAPMTHQPALFGPFRPEADDNG